VRHDCRLKRVNQCSRKPQPQASINIAEAVLASLNVDDKADEDFGAPEWSEHVECLLDSARVLVAVTYGQVPKNEPFRSCPSCANSLDEVSIGSDT
jgi:hypothetical protein